MSLVFVALEKNINTVVDLYNKAKMVSATINVKPII